jgi:putative toxin-antitoxin system antitoxin component (TIGR02293 family)
MKNPAKTTKSHKGPGYDPVEDTGTHQVSEPIADYMPVRSSAMARTIGIMGMNGKRDFSGVKSENDFINVIRNGVSREVMDHLMEVADISLAEMAAIVHTSDRTLRRYTPHQKLSEEQTERMIEMARLYGRGEEVLGSLNDFRIWMNTLLLPFGNRKPKEFLDTSLGISMIMEELGRIQHGVFA